MHAMQRLPPPGYLHSSPPTHNNQGPHSGYPLSFGCDPQSRGPPPAQAPAYSSRLGYAPPPRGFAPVTVSPQVLPNALPTLQDQSFDFKHDRPDVYAAFESTAIRSTRDGGIDVRLPDGMCQDKHVRDFLQCFRCWLLHHQGDHRTNGNPWRIQCLNLSGNGLSDASVACIIQQLQSFDLRLEYLYLRGNRIEAKALEKITQYLWNCPDPLLEIDLASNQIDIEFSGNTCSDPVSALLRCLYNHSSYPKIIAGHDGVAKVVPLILRLGRNRVQEPARLLKAIEVKVGKSRLQIRPSPDVYDRRGEEFLSLCLPEFLEQAPPIMRDRGRKRRRSRSTHRRVQLTAAPGAAEPPTKTVNLEKAKKLIKKEKTHKKSKRSLVVSSPQNQELQQHLRHKPSKSQGRSSSRDAKAGSAAHQTQAGDDGPIANIPALVIPETELRALQQEVSRKLGKYHLPQDNSTVEDLSELVVCMASAGKGAQEIQAELAPFLGERSSRFVKWFGKHIQRYKKS